MEKFIDYAVVQIRSGNGGRGAVSFYSNRQGPCGGKGGKGGDVIIVGDTSINNLEYFKYKVHFDAEDGNPGGSNNVTGKNGKNIIIKVPIGTEITYLNNNIYIKDNKPIILLKGGRGGLGNGSFKSALNQVPRYSQPGEPGKSSKMTIELKVLGDFGLIGAPNAGKSTLLTSLTNSKSRIGDYAFTTLRPYQGMYENICIVDLPGLVIDAHLGKGLGFRFLKHAENCRNLILVVDVSNKPIYHIEFLLNEIDIYGLQHPTCLVLNKIDTIKNTEAMEIYQHYLSTFKKIFCISAKNHNGLNKLKSFLRNN